SRAATPISAAADSSPASKAFRRAVRPWRGRFSAWTCGSRRASGRWSVFTGRGVREERRSRAAASSCGRGSRRSRPRSDRAMKLAEEHGPEHTVLRVEGSLKVGDTAQTFSETCERIARERRGALVLDLSGLEYMDSTGVGVLIGALKRFQEGKREI